MLYPDELLDQIRGIYDKGLVSEHSIAFEEFTTAIRAGAELTLAELPHRLAQKIPEDIHCYISWFSCFKENNDDEWDDDDYSGRDISCDELPLDKLMQAKSVSNKKVKARKNRKLSKASKRKNRK